MSMSTMTVPAAPPPVILSPGAEVLETAADLLRELRRLYGEGKLDIRLDFGRLNHMDSPVGVEADSNIWAYGVIAVTVPAAWWGGWFAGMAVFLLGAVGYFTIGRHYVHRRVETRVEKLALTDTLVWQKLWRFGGLTLVALDRGAVEPCAAPDGNWLAFVRQLRAATAGSAS